MSVSPLFNVNLAYSLCYWVDSGGVGDLPGEWQVYWKPTAAGVGYAVVFQYSNQPIYAFAVQGTQDVKELILETEVATQTSFPYVTGNANVASGNFDLLQKTLQLLGSRNRPQVVTDLSYVVTDLAKAGNQFLVTGHSLGGATAALLAPYIGSLIDGNPISALPSNIAAITFATPAIGDSNFAGFLNTQSNYMANFNVNDAIPYFWSCSGDFSIPNMYNLFPQPGPSPIPGWLRKKIEHIVGNMPPNVSYQQTIANTFTFPTIPESGSPDDAWFAELGYQHNIAYDVQFGRIASAPPAKSTV